MFKAHFSWSRPACLLGLLTLVLLVAGCGGGGGGGNPLSGMQNLTDQTFHGTEPGDEAVGAIDQVAGGSLLPATDDDLLGADRAMRGPTRAASGTFDVTTTDGLHITGSWTYNSITDFFWTATVTGTTADGTTVNITKTVRMPAAPYNVTITGTLQKDGVTYALDINKTLTVVGDVWSLAANWVVTKDGTLVYEKHTVKSITATDPAPRPRTITGWVERHNLALPTLFVRVTFSTLVYVPDGDHLDFISGGATILDEVGRHAELTANATDHSLSGPIYDSLDQVIGTMTIVDGVVTIVIT